ncbi:MAG: type 2 isopentenyl-diphosphate Delta-isomerase [Deltaproteobacteria bacterium]|nr:MAG: type 2 isopentenyl-diphosphate Delta-isomerase [Deltaproteobacteria bacterium]
MTIDHDDPALLSERKVDHLELCRRQDVEYRDRTTLLEEVQLLHDTLPEVHADRIDLGTRLCGRSLRLPFMISGMTGGAREAAAVNRTLAAVAQARGLAFGVGSQRAMLRDPGLRETYAVRDVAPDIFLCGNIGVTQAVELGVDGLGELVEAIGADALCVHLNPAQETIQDHGDRDFTGCVEAIGRAVEGLPVPVIAKETGCGMSPRPLARLAGVGVRTVDVSGAGGTTWVGVEALRGSPRRRALGELLWDWGVPTAAAVVWGRRAGMEVIASGGLRNGLDAARAIALGASVASAALPWLRAAMDGGEQAALDLADHWEDALRAVCLLTGSADLDALRRAPRILGPTLRQWVDGAAEGGSR